jgi:RNA polymerase sigma-70 factor (ECF subfamily)
MDLGPAVSADQPLPPPIEAANWIEPIPDERVIDPDAGPEAQAIERESIRLAFLSAIQQLPPRQRAVLILRDVLRWRAAEVADLLEMTVAGVNSALQRAHETLERRRVPIEAVGGTPEPDDRAILARYIDAFERYDMDALTAVLREDATWSMPPYEMWLQTHDDVRAWCLGPGIGCRGSRLLPLDVNGSHGFAQYKPAPDGTLRPWSVQVVEIENGRISGLTFFLDTERFFPMFGVPAFLPA